MLERYNPDLVFTGVYDTQTKQVWCVLLHSAIGLGPEHRAVNSIFGAERWAVAPTKSAVIIDGTAQQWADLRDGLIELPHPTKPFYPFTSSSKVD